MNSSLLIAIVNNRVFQSLAGLLITILIGIFLTIYFNRGVESKHKRWNIKYRVSYLMIFIFLVVLARIWLTGIYHLFTVLSLVAAGLVVANKETMMNFVGALIINWRNLFSEGDRISFSHYTGYVTKIGVLYFTLNETSEYSLSRASGKILRIPNGLVITNPVINYSQNLNVFEMCFSLIITQASDVNAASALLLETVRTTLSHYFQHNREYTAHYTKKRNQFAQTLLDSSPSIVINLLYGEPVSVELKACFYAYSKDHQEIKNAIAKTILEKLPNYPNITLGKTP